MELLCGLSLGCTAAAVLVVWIGLVVETFAPKFTRLADTWALRISLVMLLAAVSMLLAAGVNEGRKPMPVLAPAPAPAPAVRPDVNGVRRLPPLPERSGDWIDLGNVLGQGVKVRVY